MAAALALSASGCGVDDIAAALLVPISDENALGADFADQVEAEQNLHPDPQVQQWIQDLGQSVLRGVEDVPEGITFTFQVIDDDETVNAFALPGGYIYFYTGLLLMADTEAEVAGVMGHEIAHVTQRHIAKRLVADFGYQTVVGMALGQEPGVFGSLVSNLLEAGGLITYGRGHESEADDVGIEYVIAAGYNPNGFVTFFEKLDAMQGGINLPEWLSTHPLPSSRIENAREI
ncbi:MAG: M48 family metalloprotease, partial [Phycisphaerales bacterium]|nr:M48 family metalloprotease [Phycisphaerales bacterium]